MTHTWGYRIIAHHDGDDTTYGLHEVSYEDGVPSVSSHALLMSDTRDFIGVFRRLEDAVARPLLDPAKPEKTPRSLSHVQRAMGYIDGFETDLGYLPGSAEAKAVPLTLAQIVTHHRQWAVDIQTAIGEGRLDAETQAKALSDYIMSLRIAKTLAPLEAHAAQAQQASTLIQNARDVLYKVEEALSLDDGQRDLFDEVHKDLENAGGLVSGLSVAPGPDNCQRCKGARGGAPGNENRVAGEVLCDDCTVDADQAARGKPAGVRWDPSTEAEG